MNGIGLGASALYVYQAFSLDSLLDASVGFWKLLWETVNALSSDLTLHLA